MFYHLTIAAVLVNILEIVSALDEITKCGDDWKFWNENCYKYFILAQGAVTWDSAEANCTDFGAHLASIHSAEEQQFIWKSVIANQNCTRDCAWIGMNVDRPENANCHWKENRCRWSDGSLFDFSYWMPGEPNGIGSEHCSMIDSRCQSKWNDIVCSGLQRIGGWVCKMPFVKPQSDYSYVPAITIPLVVVAVAAIILVLLFLFRKKINFLKISDFRFASWFKSNKSEDSVNLVANVADSE